jgi:hypothetical protein
MNGTAGRRFGPIPVALDHINHAISRSTLYAWAAVHNGLFLKSGTRTIVDLNKLDDIIAALPSANIKPQIPSAPDARDP